MTVIIPPNVVGVTLMTLFAKGGGASRILRKPPPPSATQSSVSGDTHIILSFLSKLYNQWFQVSSLVRFFVSGNFGNVCFFFIERMVYRQLYSNLDILPAFVSSYLETCSFFLGYALQIVTQHFLHAVLVYGWETIDSREKYFKTLISQFYAYGLALVGSTILNLFLIRSGVDKTLAFFSTMMIFACVNYYLIGWLVKRAVVTSEEETNTKGKKGVLQQLGKQGNLSAKSRAKDTRNAALRRIGRGGAFGIIIPEEMLIEASPSHGWISKEDLKTSSSGTEYTFGAFIPINVEEVNRQEYVNQISKSF